MIAYIIRRILYAIPILIGVNLITFILFFTVNTPDDMARMHLGMKRVTPEAIEKWKAEHGYDRPVLYNTEASGVERLTGTIFFEKSVRLFAFDFGHADDGRDISHDIRERMWPSLAIAIPVLLVGLLVNITFAMLMAFFRPGRSNVIVATPSSYETARSAIALAPVLRARLRGRAFECRPTRPSAGPERARRRSMRRSAKDRARPWPDQHVLMARSRSARRALPATAAGTG